MRRPKVVAENYQQVYDYYDKRQPNRIALRGLFAATSALYWPHVRFADGAENNIRDLLNSQHRMVMGSNHISMADQFPIASAIRKKRALSPIAGNTVAIAKPWFFKHPGARQAVDALGGIPAFRSDEIGEDSLLRTSASKRLVEVTQDKIKDGYHVLIFPEGTRNKNDITELGKIFKGIGRIAYEASQDVPVALLPMALWYGGDDKKHSFVPYLYFSNPIAGPFESELQVNEAFADSLAQSLSIVRQLSSIISRA